MQISVVLPTRNPHPGRLARTLAGLSTQTLPSEHWELFLVDNASDVSWCPPAESLARLPQVRRLTEPQLGLTPARLCGIRASEAPLLLFVDDDNVLAPDYLAEAVRLFATLPNLGTAGGKIVPEFTAPPPAWTREFWGLLALRDLGSVPLLQPGAPSAPWPSFAPVGAGLLIRRSHALAYADALSRDGSRRALDRRGSSLGSGGDSDLVFTALHRGGDAGYFPSLSLTHLIPPGRLELDYLCRINAGIARTWIAVLDQHAQCPWKKIPAWSVPLRAARAWLRTGAWRSPAHRVRWHGLVGTFRGQADLPPSLS